MGSLRRKIVLGYGVIGLLVVALSLFILWESREVEGRILVGERIAELFDAALELRRFEKNYFLYRQNDDLAEHRVYLDQALDLLRDPRHPIAAIGDPRRIAQLQSQLVSYRELVEDYARSERDPLKESNIRQTGKDILGLAEEFRVREQRALRDQLDRQRQILMGAVTLVALLVTLAGHLLARRVVRPLTEMVTNMRAVAAGRLAALDLGAGDQEMRALSQAFNHVLRELETRQGQLVRAEKLASLGTLLSGVAHELNNPLSNVSTSCQILLEEQGEADQEFQRELLDQIDQETWRARRIVTNLLDYARERPFRAEIVELAPLVDATLRLIKGQIPSQVEVHNQVPPSFRLAGDRPRLQQVLLNLLGNALDALDGAGEIWIEARRTQETCAPDTLVFGQCGGQGPAVEISVRDTGRGIAPATLPRIFDPFYTTKDVGRGLGLGLFITFEIIQEHGGCVAVASRPEQGTTFNIRLPDTPLPGGSPPTQAVTT